MRSPWDKRAGKHWWIVPLNQALETVCRRGTDQADAAQVYAKVRLINRAYSANLERNRKVRWPEWEVAKAFAKSADPVMQRLHGVGRLHNETLWQVVGCHADLTRLARHATQTWTISFCSKYLSFHFPETAPIYDSISVNRAKALVPSPDGFGCDERVFEYDYGKHCLRVLRLLERLQQAGVRHPKLRVVDFLLYAALPESAAT